MLESSIVLGTVRGIRIGVHYTWFVIFALLTFSLTFVFQDRFPEWGQAQLVIMAAVTCLLFFASIVLHELGHSLVALSRGIPVRSITLFIFGGVARMERDADSAGTEFWIAIAGPLVSLALALGFYWLSGVAAPLSDAAAVAFGWLALINLAVAVFNMVPGFPLDGGRIFRAAIWALYGDAQVGMRWAVWGGRIVAYGLLAIGVYIAVGHGLLLNGVWLAAISWFLLSAAEAAGRDFTLRERLRGVTAHQLLEPRVPFVASGTALQEWVDGQVLPEGRRAALVERGGEAVGLVTLSDTRRVPRGRWGTTTVDEVMTPRGALFCVSPHTGADAVLRLMDDHGLNQIPVMEGTRVMGWIDRDRLLRNIQLHVELDR